MLLLGKLKEKSIVEEIKDKNMNIEKLNLVPNKSVGIFLLGDDIQKYLYLPHNVIHHEENEPIYDSYDFYKSKVILWTEEGKIKTIRCTLECYWKGHNLIKMPFDEFLYEYKVNPDKSEMLYTLVSENRGQNQMVHDFNDLGLMIWVWRKKIVTVIISNERKGIEEELVRLTKLEFENWKSKFSYYDILLKTIKIKRREKGESYQSHLDLKFIKDRINYNLHYIIYDNYKQLFQEDGFTEYIRNEFDKFLSEKAKGEEHSRGNKR